MIVYDRFGKGIIAGFSERGGGVSPFPSGALNLSFSREPYGCRENVLRNYAIAAESLGIDVNSVTRMPQVHSDSILKVTSEHRGMGVTREIPEPLLSHGYDGMITDVPGITLSTTHADCTPVMLFDPMKRAVAAVHSGWKGTVLKIAGKAVSCMAREYGTDPKDVKAIIGPAISFDRFEVREDVANEFYKAFGEEIDRGGIALVRGPAKGETDPKWHVNMRAFVKIALTEAGVRECNITDDESCTFTQESRFFSHRRDRGNTGAMAAFVSITE